VACRFDSNTRERVIQKIIDRLTIEDDSSESCSLLPLYLKQAGDNRKLLQYLSPDRLAKLLDSQHQISPVRQQVLLGLETARDLNNYSETMRFAVQSSALSEYSGFTVSESEISARMELQNDASCIALAQAAVLTNDRLRLLAVVARKKRERGDTLEPELVGEVETLFERAEWNELSSDALNELATDLVYVRPDLATRALEKGTSTNSDSSKRLDLALASASLAAAMSQDNAVRDSSQSLRAGIKNPRFLSMFNALAAILRGVDAGEIIEKVRELSAAKDQIHLLRQWSMHSQVTEAAGSVTSYALDVAIRATEYTPTATDFRELAETLHRVSDPQELIDLIRRFDAQRASIEVIGPTTDFQYLQLLLALGEAKVDWKAAANRLVEVYSAVDQIKDLAVRTACLARILDLLPLIDTGSIRRREGIEELVCQSFEAALDALLSSTADHSHATRDIIAALVPRHVKMALRVALALNTSSRRDDALAWLVSSMLRVQDQKLNLSELRSVLDSFYDPDDAEAATCQVLERLASLEATSPIQTGVKEAIIFAAGYALKFRDGEYQVRACCAAILCINRFAVPSGTGLTKSLIERMRQSWDRLDVDADRIALGFRVSARLASLDRKMAEEWLAKAESCRASHSISASSDPYRHCLLLISRSYMGLVMKRLDQQDDLTTLARLIDRIPSSIEQLLLWTDVALRILSCGRLKEAQEIGTSHIQRLIAHYQSGTCERFKAIVIAMPALFHTSRVTATDLLAELPPAWVNSAVIQVVNYILKKRPSWDPYETRHHQTYTLTIDELYSLCDLAARATADVTIYWIISTIADSLRTKEARRTITGNQRSDLIIKLKEIKNTRFPTPNFIAHLGYRVLCSVNIAQLERYQKKTWEEIIADVLAIPNVADKCLVLTDAAGAIAKHDDVWAISILKDCQRYAQDIPSALDRAQRMQMMASEAYAVNKELARDFYTQALLMTAGDTAPEYEHVRRDIIDSAHQISPELASSIASAMDDDQARRAKRGVSSRIELLELRHRLMDQRPNEDELPEGARDRLAEASWALLGSLNSERIVPVRISHTRPYLERAADLPFSAAFAIYSYVIENALQRPQERSEEERNLRGLYRSLTGSAELFYFLAERGIARIPSAQPAEVTDRDQFCFVDADQRGKGVAYIEKWLIEKTGSTLTIHDPYLLPVDVVDILKMILLVKPSLEVNLITSKVGLQRARIASPFAGQFRAAWTETASQSAPVTRIIVVAVGSEGNPLIHDRWWCSDESGLDFGTSFNSLGNDKGSKIRIMPKDEASQAAARLASITGMRLRYIEEKRVVYESVDL